MHIPAYSWDSRADFLTSPIWMLKETLQGPSESSGSNYYHKENLIIRQAIIGYLYYLPTKFWHNDFLFTFFRFVFVTYGYFFYSSGLPRKFPGPSNEWLCVVCLCHCCVSRLLCCSSVLWILRSELRKPCILRRLQYKQTCAIFQCRSHDIENMCQASFLSII